MRKGHGRDPDTLILNELGLCQGAARVDVAVVNGSVHGYEIKSPCDTLVRLAGQAEVYGRVLDYVTIVVGEKHVKIASDSVPCWWGVWSAAQGSRGVRFKRVRKAYRNPKIEPLAVAQLLWRSEVLDALARLGLAQGFRSKPRAALWRCLADAVSLNELRNVVRQCLKNRRPDWRVDAPPE